MTRFCLTAAFAAFCAVPAAAQPAEPATNPEVPTTTGESDVVVWAWAGQENLCPFGSQPVTVDGTISCGVPNQTLTYQQMLRNPQGN
ncbi:MAG: hypothetical protein AAGD04_16170 [Pseudomonadota bacterium]